MLNNIPRQEKYFIVILIFFILAGVIFRFAILNSWGFWLDEAWQFWTSKGLHHYQLNLIDAVPKDVSLLRMAKDTHYKLLGAPTFTILLYYWSKISNSESWLRIIPCLFGIGVLPIIYHIAIRCGFSKKWALTIVTFSTWNASWLFYSVELRPYSFEIFCSALTLLFLIKILTDGSILNYTCLSLSILLGITSGYGYHIYYPFIVIFLFLYIAINRDSGIKKLIKALILIASIIISIFYIMYFILCLPITQGFQAHYLTYLSQFKESSYLLLNTLKMIISGISWQLFWRSWIISPRFFNIPIGLPFLTISALFLMYSIFMFIISIKKKYILVSVVFALFIYSITMCTFLSIKGLAPVGPVRHNLFFSPSLFICFFICIKHAYGLFKKNILKLKENHFLIYLLVFLLVPNIHIDYLMLPCARFREDLREGIRKIQKTVKKNDKICAYINQRGIPCLKYELQYSNIPWIRSLKYEDVFTDLSFNAYEHNGYDYQWYIFGNTHEESEINRARNILRKKYDIIIDQEFFLVNNKVAGFRARVK